MIDIYFVRHGETGGNIAKRHQQEDTKLTPLGRRQAITVAAHVLRKAPTHFFVSRRVRALETGQSLAIALDVAPETSDLFVEICRPANMYGHQHRSVKTLVYLWQWWRGKVGAENCGVDGESYKAFRQRLSDAKQFLADLPSGSRVVVVSHSVFISMFTAHMNHERPLSLLGAIKTFLKIKSIPNGGIVHVQFEPNRIPAWQVVRDIL